MIIVERHHIKGTPEIEHLCGLSKELYNRCNFLMRKTFFEHKTLPNLTSLKNSVKTLDCYKGFNQCDLAMATVLQVSNDWSNFFKTLKVYNIDKSKFNKCPKPPNYKNKLAQIIFNDHTIKCGRTKNRYIKYKNQIIATKDLFKIKSNKKYKQVVVTPKKFGFMIEVQYEKEKEKTDYEIKKTLKKGNFLAIDLGINNLCTITSNQFSPILINGCIIKSINQHYNKKLSKTKDEHYNKRNIRKRYFRIENYFHHTSKFIIDLCKKHDIGRIIIGKNDGIKQNSNMGKRNNQSFQSIPHNNLAQKISYKAEWQGIEVLQQEEAYTSKASFVEREPIPKYGENKFNYSGTRKGKWFTRANGKKIHADVNGSLNIVRKVIQDESILIPMDKSLDARPCKINVLKKQVGEGLVN